MLTSSKQYSLDYIKNIIFNDDSIMSFKLPQDVIDIINNIASEVGSPQYVKTPVFTKVVPAKPEFTRKKKKNNNNKNNENSEDWKQMLDKSKVKNPEDTNTDLNSIRSILNKLTDTNYEKYSTKIKDVFKNLGDAEYAEKVSDVFFDIISSNNFYSHIYAKMYSELLNDTTINTVIIEQIKDTLINKINLFVLSFDNIGLVDSTEDYNGFCELNKENERRKSLAKFIMNLSTFNVIENIIITDIVKTLVVKISEHIVMENSRHIVDELIENIHILYSSIENTDLYDTKHDELYGLTIKGFIEKMSKSSFNEYPSLSNKAIFKCMDIIEIK